jgi:threonine synthase
MIKYQSTRGAGELLSFEDILLQGLAPDGGLYVPSEMPHFSPAELVRLSQMKYHDLAYEIISPFVGDALPPQQLRQIIDESYASFAHKAVTPLVQIDHNHFILELFHGETLAFKDVALQFLGRVMDAILQKSSKHLTIIGATSGDTGSAAIAGCKGRESMDVVILYPHDRTSDVQRRQMTTVQDANIHCLAVEGTFDDCQNIVKELFVDSELRAKKPLGAVNSINWTRIVAQIVYYFYAAFRLGSPMRKIAFSVPTGNFGDIYAGYLAKKMGLPIEKLIIASNSNDILTRCLRDGEYRIMPVAQTLSPSMDIGISSNFERLLFDLHDRNANAVAGLMLNLKNSGAFRLNDSVLRKLRNNFAAVRADDAQTTQVMQSVYNEAGYLLDPHTATGVFAVQQMPKDDTITYVTLATAHPAKFPDAVIGATGVAPKLPAHLSDLFERTERYQQINSSVQLVRNYLLSLV